VEGSGVFFVIRNPVRCPSSIDYEKYSRFKFQRTLELIVALLLAMILRLLFWLRIRVVFLDVFDVVVVWFFYGKRYGQSLGSSSRIGLDIAWLLTASPAPEIA
jgi:hypothetical protein